MPTSRYSRQVLLPQVGQAGQDRLSASAVIVIGVGALGCGVADLLARAGVGRLTLVDRDLVELSNLHRQTLFATADLGQPKAVAAADRLAAVNPDIAVAPLIRDVNSQSILELLPGHALAIDCTDNAATRYLLNDAALHLGLPWVYGGAVGVEGRAAAFHPGQTACLRCLFRQPPAPGELPTCDTAGVLNTTTSLIATLQAQLALRLLLDPQDAPARMVTADLWTLRLTTLDLTDARADDCPCCARLELQFLHAPPPPAITLCGHDTIQILPPRKTLLNLQDFAARWQGLGPIRLTKHLLKLQLETPQTHILTLFADGRLLIQGLSDLAGARSLYDRYVGS